MTRDELKELLQELYDHETNVDYVFKMLSNEPTASNSIKLPVSGRSEQLRGEMLEQKAKEALQEIHNHTTLCVDEDEEHIFICGYNAGYNAK
jgi:hypothetical protein